MAFSINTNIASLQAQEYLRITNDFQTKTIGRVTSGLRIISSGDDAAGLAIANGFRSDRAVLTQGVRNANDGLSTLQTIDGGINNISQLLDRARTLAAQSASGTFTGDRTVLNSEFQSVVTEIDRQAQAIGLNSGGVFATQLGVFVGGGRGSTPAAQISNGSVNLDLSTSTVDALSLGLKGYQAVGGTAGTTDIGTASMTSVATIVANTTNTASLANSGYTDLYFRGPGFSDADRIRVAVTLGGINDPTTLVDAVNAAIDAAGNGGTQYATAFKNANVRASIVTDSATGKQRLGFTSSTHAFQVAGGDRLSNALLGNFSAASTGAVVSYAVSGGAVTASGATTFSAAGNVVVRIQGSSLAAPQDVTLTVTTATTVTNALSSLSSLVANNSALQAAGITLTTATAGAALQFSANRGEKFDVLVAGDDRNLLGLGTSRLPTGSGLDYSSITGAGAVFTTAGSVDLLFSVGGGTYQTVAIATTGASTISTVLTDINAAIAQNATLAAAGLVAENQGGQVKISSTNGSLFRLGVGATNSNNLGFGTAAGATTTSGVVAGGFSTAATVNSGGAASSGALSYLPVRLGTDDQTIAITANDSSGVPRSVAINLDADATGTPTARSIDESVRYINQQLQATNDTTLRKIVAVKEYDPSSGTEKIRFLGSLPSFKVSVGDNPGDTGITSSQGQVVNSNQLSGGATADISTKENAEAAVSALADAVASLGEAQASVGKGQNQFNFAISLAQTQLNNLAASESRIRDADLAAEAANLTKSQILLQAGIAALAQANSAPQAVLSLLRG